MNVIETQSESPFYVTGGTLSRDALCYVTRQADHELYDCLRKGNFSYVLTARQMGKSSLMVRTASRLRDEGVGVVVLDLTAIGQNLSAEQWYGGLLTQMAQQLGLEDELEDFWDSQARLGPLQRWMQAVRRVVLPRYPGRVVIFIDEIDAVRSLPFSTDEFFAGIREFYNHRTEDPELERLSFCLLGVAAPSDLIRDTRMTPFNIGQRIELHDFSEAEAQVLAFGLSGGEQEGLVLLNRILSWTGGHPYLTQRLCQAASEAKPQSTIRDLQSVDRLCEELFFEARAREQDDNLLFVRERVLRSEVDLAGLLGLYERVHRGRPVEDDETNPFVTILKLSGITRIEGGRLRVRNRVYERVFDQAWVSTNMPDAEVKRQRAAYRKGLLRAAAIAAVILVAMASLVFVAVRQRNLARTAEETNRQQLYAAQMNLAARDWQDSSIERMRELLALQVPRPGQNDLRGFEWYLLWTLAHPDRQTLRFSGIFSYFIFSPDLMMFAARDTTGVRKLWNMASGRQVNTLQDMGLPETVEISSDGNLLAADSEDNSITLWDLPSGMELRRLKGHTESINTLAFSRDGKILASNGRDQTVRLWDVGTGRLLVTIDEHANVISCIALSRDGKRLATGNVDLTVRLWDVSTGKRLMTLKRHPATQQSNSPDIERVAFSPDGSRILATGGFMNLAVWDAVTGEALPALQGHRFYVSALALSLDGKLMATGSDDRTILLWDLDTWSVIKTLVGHGDRIVELAFSHDSKTLASASSDKTIKLWDVAADPNPLEQPGVQLVAYSADGGTLASINRTELRIWDTTSWKVVTVFSGNTPRIVSLAYSGDAEMLAFGSEDNSVSLWDVAAGKVRFVLRGHTDKVWGLAFAPDGKLLATGSVDGTVRLWDVTSGQELAKLEGCAGIALSPDGRLLALPGCGRSVKLWDVISRRESAILESDVSEAYQVSFSPNGKLLAIGADDTIRIWDVAASKELCTLKGHAGQVNCSAFSPDSKRLATAGQDFTVRLWDVATGQELATLRRHTAPVWSVAFSPDGTALVSAGRDGILRVWRAATEQDVRARGNQ